MKKRRLNDINQKMAVAMLQKGLSIGSIAKNFNTTKPSVLKSIHMWSVGTVNTKYGIGVKVHRGKPLLTDPIEEPNTKSVKELVGEPVNE